MSWKTDKKITYHVSYFGTGAGKDEDCLGAGTGFSFLEIVPGGRAGAGAGARARAQEGAQTGAQARAETELTGLKSVFRVRCWWGDGRGCRQGSHHGKSEEFHYDGVCVEEKFNATKANVVAIE